MPSPIIIPRAPCTVPHLVPPQALAASAARRHRRMSALQESMAIVCFSSRAESTVTSNR